MCTVAFKRGRILGPRANPPLCTDESPKVIAFNFSLKTKCCVFVPPSAGVTTRCGDVSSARRMALSTTFFISNSDFDITLNPRFWIRVAKLYLRIMNYWSGDGSYQYLSRPKVCAARPWIRPQVQVKSPQSKFHMQYSVKVLTGNFCWLSSSIVHSNFSRVARFRHETLDPTEIYRECSKPLGGRLRGVGKLVPSSFRSTQWGQGHRFSRSRETRASIFASQAGKGIDCGIHPRLESTVTAQNYDGV